MATTENAPITATDSTDGKASLAAEANCTAPDFAVEALSRVLLSETFLSAPNLAKILSLNTLAGRTSRQTDIANEMGYHPFNQVEHSKVRREIGRLRTKLRDYYDREGMTDFLTIIVPNAREKRGYRVEFCIRQRQAPGAPLEHSNAQRMAHARYLWSLRTPDALAESIRIYTQVAIEDPERSSPALAALAECYCFMALWGFPAYEMMPTAKQWAIKAIDRHRVGGRPPPLCRSTSFML
jgi:hypothetical protein